jgi:polyisoprenoid-binding protein YceI
MTFSLKELIAVALISTAPLPSVFAADNYTLDPAHTQAIFTIDHLGFSTINPSAVAIVGHFPESYK